MMLGSRLKSHPVNRSLRLNPKWVTLPQTKNFRLQKIWSRGIFYSSTGWYATPKNRSFVSLPNELRIDRSGWDNDATPRKKHIDFDSADFKMIKPVVGLLMRREKRKEKWVNFMGEYHLQLLQDNGAVELLIPVVQGGLSNLGYYREQLSGLMIVEGPDVDPQFYRSTPESSHLIGETEPLKDAIEFRLAKWALQHDIPVLGICRGCQILNVVSKGLLYGDVQKEIPSTVQHHQGEIDFDFRHHVRVVKGTPLYDWYNRESLMVTSYHHQGVRVLAKRFQPMAFADDGLIEAFYDPQSKFTVGLQFHPERMFNEYEGNAMVYSAFVKACKQRAIQDELKKSTAGLGENSRINSQQKKITPRYAEFQQRSE